MNWRKVLKAALIAAASGAVGAVAQSAQEGAKPEALQTAAIAGAILGLVGHLTQSPIDKKPEAPTEK